jgi:hypothetical protein
MQRFIGQTRRPALCLALMACLVVLAGTGCAGSGVGTAGGVGKIVTRMANARSPVGGDHQLTISASCRSGEQMLAGGYAVVDVFESDYSLLSAYPSAAETWTVSADSGANYELQSLAYCLASAPSLGIQRLQASACPQGTVHLSSGFQGVILSSGNARTPFVLCASRGVTPTAHGFRIGTTELDCANQATGSSQSESRTFSYTCVVVRSAS